MLTVCETNQCAGCMACIDVCPKGAVALRDDLISCNAVIDEEKCVRCGRCYRVCQAREPAELREPVKWYQGWAGDAEIRKNASSGGMATALAKYFIEQGGCVCSCQFNGGEFSFSFVDDVDELKRFVGSKYVKSNPKGVYRELRQRVIHGEKVLFIGLPCQVSAVKKLVGERDNLYAIDLICHGTPSEGLLKKFFEQHGYAMKMLESIQFRDKGRWRISGSAGDRQVSVSPVGVMDMFSVAFLNGLSYTVNCYSCRYASTKRVSDITLGDSWGSRLPEKERKQGISLILCQTEKGADLVEHCGAVLHPVDITTAIENNGQLRSPSAMPECRGVFFKGLEAGKTIDRMVRKMYPVQCLRQAIKRTLIKLVPEVGEQFRE